MAAVMEQLAAFAAEHIHFSGADFSLLGLNMVGCAIFYYFLRMLKVPDHSW